jgi:Reverse transcriptase (RNA-dependent DNA polymerase)
VDVPDLQKERPYQNRQLQYRPITLLNTDYKLLTKVLAIQLIEHAHALIDEDQAGFIPKRSIFNHIRLAKAVINYADATEEDGAIIALDQEKAYDKIRHNYLWVTLEAFNLPRPFINTIQLLYKHTTTQVAINGVFSTPLKVQCGVRQGDPLSCLLFNLAIEPLACKLQNDPNLKDLDIPGLHKKLILAMFADDTTLFLSKLDRFDHVQHILDQWCSASGAKFNIQKTEIIPIGSPTHRTTVIETHKLNPNDTLPLDDRIHITRDGEAIRSLGAWISNNTPDLTPWQSILDKINTQLANWNRSHPTLRGRKLITQAVIGRHTQFLTKAQGMPPEIEEALDKIT